MRIERLITAGIAALAILFAVAAQTGVLDFSAVTSTLIGSAASIAVPPLDDPAMIRRGAAHYDRVCANCHASPDRPDRAEHLELMPPAAKLHLRIEGWLPEVLLTTVKHGIENTAMPAWPTQDRDDEIWSMVAFLTVLPQLDAATYRGLAGLEAATANLPPLVATCARCHGVDGSGTPDGAFPRLDIQTADYLLDALEAFREGRRASGFMLSAVSGLQDEELLTLAEHFAGEASASLSNPPLIVTGGASDRKIPACGACHGPPDIARPEFPRLAGQYEAYLVSQLRLFANEDRSRGGGPFVPLMHEAGAMLTEADIAELAAWYGRGRR